MNKITLILAIITLLTSCNSDGIYEATLRLDEINKPKEGWSVFPHYSASKIEGERIEVMAGTIKDTSFFTEAKVGDTIKVVVNENDKTTKIYFKGKLIDKGEIPLDWDLRK
jgi:hypothetical protein